MRGIHNNNKLSIKQTNGQSKQNKTKQNKTNNERYTQ